MRWWITVEFHGIYSISNNGVFIHLMKIREIKYGSIVLSSPLEPLLHIDSLSLCLSKVSYLSIYLPIRLIILVSLSLLRYLPSPPSLSENICSHLPPPPGPLYSIPHLSPLLPPLLSLHLGFYSHETRVKWFYWHENDWSQEEGFTHARSHNMFQIHMLPLNNSNGITQKARNIMLSTVYRYLTE